ncbi:phosphopentomutase [Petrachloros mirabilis]
MINRVVLLVVDGFGVGASSDATAYGDAETHTLAHLAESAGGLSLPTLESLGLGHVSQIEGVRAVPGPIGCFGRMAFAGKGVDSLAGFWEIAGCVVESEGPIFRDAYPDQVVAALEEVFGRKVLGHRLSSGAEALQRCGADHLSTGAPIVWSDGRQTCHVAAHNTVWSAEELYQRSKELRKTLKDVWSIRRVVAHPLVDTDGKLEFGAGRRDFSGEPPSQTMLDVLNRAGQILIGVGKVSDLFGGRGLTRSVAAHTWTGALDEVSGMFSRVPRGLIFAGLDIISQNGNCSASALQDFDRRLSELVDQLRQGDLLVVTGDHGRDPGAPHGRSTREYVPLLMTGPRLSHGVNVGVRRTAADVGQTIVEALGGEVLPVGESLLHALRSG